MTKFNKCLTGYFSGYRQKVWVYHLRFRQKWVQGQSACGGLHLRHPNYPNHDGTTWETHPRPSQNTIINLLVFPSTFTSRIAPQHARLQRNTHGCPTYGRVHPLRSTLFIAMHPPLS